MSCRKCGHDMDPKDFVFHDLCHTHAYCAKGAQYFGAACSVCEELWERSKDLDSPEDAVIAFKALKGWIIGFRKNSRKRPAGMDHFFDLSEKADYQEWNSIHANLNAISQLDDSQVESQSKVIIINHCF